MCPATQLGQPGPTQDGTESIPPFFWKMVTPEELETTTDSQHIMLTEVLSETPYLARAQSTLIVIWPPSASQRLAFRCGSYNGDLRHDVYTERLSRGA